MLDELKTRPTANERERQEMLAILKRLQKDDEDNDEEESAEEVCIHTLVSMTLSQLRERTVLQKLHRNPSERIHTASVHHFRRQ